MKYIFTFFVLYSLNSYTQLQCGTPDSLYKDHVALKINNHLLKQSSDYTLPIKIHIIGTDEGNYFMSENAINYAIEKAQQEFIQHNIIIEVCNDFNYIKNTNLHDYHHLYDYSDLRKNNQCSLLNIYFTTGYGKTSNGSLFAGLTTSRIYQTSSLEIIMASSSEKTLIHELGHFLGLPHTHLGNSETGTDELVNGTNCSSAGDKFCDTPADPNIFGLVSSNCDYYNSQTDINGQIYTPDVHNHMSYSIHNCRNSFSQEQINHMKVLAQENTNKFSCDECIETTNNHSENFDFSIYPNPTASKVLNITFNKIKTNTNSFYLSIYDIHGNEIVISKHIDPQPFKNERTLDLTYLNLKSGMYYFSILNQYYPITKKLIIL